jgi:ribosomal protein L20
MSMLTCVPNAEQNLKHLMYSNITKTKDMTTIKIEKHDLLGDVIMGWEEYFKCLVPIAVVDKKKKVIRPTHGYYLPHKWAYKVENFALNNGYKFDNA